MEDAPRTRLSFPIKYKTRECSENAMFIYKRSLEESGGRDKCETKDMGDEICWVWIIVWLIEDGG